MRHLTYLAVLAGCLLAASWLELWPRTGVLRQPARLLRAVLPVALAFTAFDTYATARRLWWFDPAQVTGVRLPGGLPVEEVLFFLVVPLCAVLALEAVRRVTGWSLTGDDPGPEPTPRHGRR